MRYLPAFLPTLLLTLTFVLGNSHAFSKPLADKAKAEKVSEYFMSQLLEGEIESAYALLSAYVGIDLEQFNERGKKVVSDMKRIEQSTGKPLSFALLDKQSVGEHFYKIQYLLKYKAAALIWELNYYQPDQGWNLVDVSFNADINALFK